jgi:hypothetical protein
LQQRGQGSGAPPPCPAAAIAGALPLCSPRRRAVAVASRTPTRTRRLTVGWSDSSGSARSRTNACLNDAGSSCKVGAAHCVMTLPKELEPAGRGGHLHVRQHPEQEKLAKLAAQPLPSVFLFSRSRRTPDLARGPPCLHRPPRCASIRAAASIWGSIDVPLVHESRSQQANGAFSYYRPR